MKRREFLKSATVASLAAAGSLAGCNEVRPSVEYARPPDRPEELMHIEDAQLAVTIFTDAVMRIRMRTGRLILVRELVQKTGSSGAV